MTTPAPAVLEPMRERWNAVLLAIVNSPWSASQKLDYLRDVLAPGYVAAQQRAETPPEPTDAREQTIAAKRDDL